MEDLEDLENINTATGVVEMQRPDWLAAKPDVEAAD